MKSMLRNALRSAALIVALGVMTGPAMGAPARADATLELTARTFARSKVRRPGLAPFLRPPSGVPSLPIVVELSHRPSPSDVARLEALGVTIDRARNGRALGQGNRVAARVRADRVDAALRDPSVVRLALDGRPFEIPRPLDLTTRMVGVDAVHRKATFGDGALRGAGVTVCDIDAGIDALHPMFFRADGGLFEWVDEDRNDRLDPEVDTIELDGERYVLRALNGIVSRSNDPAPLFGSESPDLDLKLDYLYADINDDGVRNVGSMFGFNEDSPSLGEPLYVVDDVDGDDIADADEKLVALGTPKLRAFRVGDDVYRRGENLVDAPWEPAMQHGNGAAGVMVGGQAGYRAFTGVAPDADLVIATDPMGGREFAMTSFCIDEGARVVLHEYAPWITFHLDGSSDVEQLIDETVHEGIVHVNPAGNLSGSDKGYRGTLPGSGSVQIPIEVPEASPSFIILTLLWRDPDRALDLKLTSPAGQVARISTGSSTFETTIEGYVVDGTVERSPRGTMKVDLYMYSADIVGPIPSGTWSLDVTDESDSDEPMPLYGFVFDDKSGWGKGVRFASGASEAHLIGWPATADLGIAVAAHTGHPFDGDASGGRARYSGRGRRIDGEPILWISAPDNPIVPSKAADRPLSYMVYGGTSGASPHVAGAAALLLAYEPELSAVDVRLRLGDTAAFDEATGPVPNDDFGHGKLDVHRALFGESALEGVAPTLEVEDIEMAPGARVIPLRVSDPDDYARSVVLELDEDYDGTYETTLSSPSLSVSYPKLGRHVLKLRATDASGRSDATLLRIDVRSAPEPNQIEGEEPSDETHAAGGGCTVLASAAPKPSFPAAMLALTLGATIMRRRRR